MIRCYNCNKELTEEEAKDKYQLNFPIGRPIEIDLCTECFHAGMSMCLSMKPIKRE